MKCTCPDCAELSDEIIVSLVFAESDAVQINSQLNQLCGRAVMLAQLVNLLHYIEVMEHNRLMNPALAESDPLSWDLFMAEAKRIKPLVEVQAQPSILPN